MIRKIGTVITLIILLINASCVYSETNKAFMKPEEVQEYMKYMDEPEDVQRAREALFNDGSKIEYKIDINKYKDFFIDKKYSPNQKFRNGTFLSDGKFVIWHYKDPFFVYYKKDLLYVARVFWLNNYPTKSFYYDRKGILRYAIYDNIDTGGFVFDSNKNFLSKWHNLKGYDKNGKLILKSRRYIPFK